MEVGWVVIGTQIHAHIFFGKYSVARVFSFCRSARCKNAGLSFTQTYNDASFTVIFHDGKGSEAMLFNNRLLIRCECRRFLQREMMRYVAKLRPFSSDTKTAPQTVPRTDIKLGTQMGSI
jgi:hypothetical protein